MKCYKEGGTTLSVEILKNIAGTMKGKTFHHHSHILYDIRSDMGEGSKTYMEIGSYDGASAALILQHPLETSVICIDPMVAHKNQHKIFMDNINRFNTFKRDFVHHQGFSHNQKVVNNLQEKNIKTNILFIDGGHEFRDVIMDFFGYLEFMAEEGVIVFDDYYDHKHSPEVKTAVDTLIKQLPNNCFQVYNTIPNTHNAYVAYPIPFNNECILQLLPRKTSQKHPVIIMPTYYRANGTSKAMLTRSLTALIHQTYKKWTLVIVSDDYQPESELLELLETFRGQTSNEIILLHNKICERNFISNPNNRWCVAGAIAMNMGLLYARQQGFQYYLHLDDDDYWHNSHIQTVMETYHKFPTCVFVNTQSTFKNWVIPPPNLNEIPIEPNNYIPKGSDMAHSSYSFRIDTIPYYYVTTVNPSVQRKASDSLMLEAIAGFIRRSAFVYSSIYVPKQTCFHPTEKQ